MNHSRITIPVAIVGLACLGVTATAEVPRLIHYQGKLRDAGGMAVTASVDLRFRLYDGPTLDTPGIFDEAHATVAVSNGLFSVLVGSATVGGVPDSALDAAEIWLGVSIEGGAELSPRTRIASSPHAIKARSAEQLVRPDTYTAAATVDAQGRIGLGTASPAAQLHVISADPMVPALSVDAQVEITGNWWDEDFPYARQLTVANPSGTDTVYGGYTVVFTMDSQTASTNVALSSGDDVRIVYWDGGSYTELDRIGSGWNTAATQIRFRTSAAISPSSDSGDAYWVFYGNAAAGTPPANPNNIYFYYDDFTANSGWTLQGSNVAIQNGRVEFNSMIRNQDNRVYRAFTGPIDNFELTYTATVTAQGDTQAEVGVALTDAASIICNGGNDGTSTVWFVESGSIFRHFVSGAPWSGGTTCDFSPTLAYLETSFGTRYIRLTRLGSQATEYVYSDPQRTNLLGSGSVGVSTNSSTHIYAVANRYLPGYNGTITGWHDDFVVRLLVASEPTVGVGGEQTPPSGTSQETVLHIAEQTGNVGIRTASPAFALEVNGDAAKPGGGSWTAISDERLKTNVRPLEGALENLLSLRGVTYDWRDAATHPAKPGRQMGMIAQQVETVYPEWIGRDARGYKTLTFSGFEALTVESMREMAEKIDRLEQQNAALQTRIEQMEQAAGRTKPVVTINPEARR